MLCESKATIISLLLQGIHPERFTVSIIEDKVAGTIGIADSAGYAISVPKNGLKREFGFIKGSVAAKLLTVEFYRPKTFLPYQGHLEFVAVREEFRGHGIAKKMLERIFEEGKYKLYTLDVVEGNEKVMPLYESAGFRFVKKESSKGSKRPGVNFRYLMEKRWRSKNSTFFILLKYIDI